VTRTAFLTANEALDRLPPPLKDSALRGLSQLPYERRLPTFLMLEPTNACNLHCPLCPVGARVMERKLGLIDRQKYERLIDEVAVSVKQIVMNFAGEPLLHPEIGRLVAHARSRGIAVTIGTNGTHDKTAELLDAGTSEILFAVDGLTQETYGQYRVGAQLDKVLAHLHTLTEEKRRRGGGPRIVLQFVVMKHNEHEIPELMKLAETTGADEVALVPVIVNDFFSKPRSELTEQYLSSIRRFQQYRMGRHGPRPIKPALCNWAFQSVILYNGDVAMCCFDYDGRTVVGNAFEEGFYRIWKSDRYRAVRRGIVQQKIRLCRECDFSLVKPLRIEVGSPAFQVWKNGHP